MIGWIRKAINRRRTKAFWEGHGVKQAMSYKGQLEQSRYHLVQTMESQARMISTLDQWANRSIDTLRDKVAKLELAVHMLTHKKLARKKRKNKKPSRG